MSWFWKLVFIFVLQPYRSKQCSPARRVNACLWEIPGFLLNSFTAYGLFFLKGEYLRIGYKAGCPTMGIFIDGNVTVQKKFFLWLTLLQIMNIKSSSLISMGYMSFGLPGEVLVQSIEVTKFSHFKD